MGETRADLRAGKKFLRDNKAVMLSRKNPNRITLTEYNKRIAQINRMLKFK